MKAVGKHLPWWQETNSKFINPGNFQPPIPVHFKTPVEPNDKSQHQHQQQQQQHEHEETKKNHCKTSKPLHLYSRDDLIKKFKEAEYQEKKWRREAEEVKKELKKREVEEERVRHKGEGERTIESNVKGEGQVNPGSEFVFEPN